jgi:hypothetical protein
MLLNLLRYAVRAVQAVHACSTGSSAQAAALPARASAAAGIDACRALLGPRAAVLAWTRPYLPALQPLPLRLLLPTVFAPPPFLPCIYFFLFPPPTHTPPHTHTFTPLRRVEGVEPEELMARSYRQFQTERALPGLEARVKKLEVRRHSRGGGRMGMSARAACGWAAQRCSGGGVAQRRLPRRAQAGAWPPPSDAVSCESRDSPRRVCVPCD